MMAIMQVLVAMLAFMQCCRQSECAAMDCGLGVPLCGTLTLQSGLGKGAYHSDTTGVHGLWPETGSWGTSKCLPPLNLTGPSKVYECYAHDGDDDHNLWFENHEWTRHGICAGVKDADDFFTQVCSLAKNPVELLEQAREAHPDIDSMAQALNTSGFPVWSVDHDEDQVLLSACAASDGRWVLATQAEMPTKCGGPKDQSSHAGAPIIAV